jgi:hypothetical protein
VSTQPEPLPQTRASVLFSSSDLPKAGIDTIQFHCHILLLYQNLIPPVFAHVLQDRIATKMVEEVALDPVYVGRVGEQVTGRQLGRRSLVHRSRQGSVLTFTNPSASWTMGVS